MYVYRDQKKLFDEKNCSQISWHILCSWKKSNKQLQETENSPRDKKCAFLLFLIHPPLTPTHFQCQSHLWNALAKLFSVSVLMPSHYWSTYQGTRSAPPAPASAWGVGKKGQEREAPGCSFWPGNPGLSRCCESEHRPSGTQIPQHHGQPFMTKSLQKLFQCIEAMYPFTVAP